MNKDCRREVKMKAQGVICEKRVQERQRRSGNFDRKQQTEELPKMTSLLHSVKKPGAPL